MVTLTVSVPVVTVTVWAPIVAVEAMLIMAVAEVREVTVTELTVIPLPKDAVVVPCAKCVYCPVRPTERFC